MQKGYKTRHDWFGKVIHWELCKKLKFDFITKWYMHKQEYVLKNETHRILLDFELKTDHLISARRPDLINKNKIIFQSRRFCRCAGPQIENERM